MRRQFARATRLTAVAITAITLLAACSTVVDGTPAGHVIAPNAALPVTGDSGSAFDVTTKNALSDVMAFWTRAYPSLSGGKALPPLTGGLFSVDGAAVWHSKHVTGGAANEACVKRDPTFIVDNAAYCDLDDSIIWDRTPSHLLGVLGAKYGTLLIAMVFAHEFGHAIQHRLHIDPDNQLPTIDIESQADCASGAFIASALKGQAPHFDPSAGALDRALEGFLLFRDSTPESGRDISHGDGFDRLSAFDNGIQHGVSYCYSSTYFSTRTFTERPYVTDSQSGIADAQDGGNEPLVQVLNAGDPKTDPNAGGLQPDLNRFWKAAAQKYGKSWTDVKIAEAPHPKCGSSASSEFGYCPADNTVYYSAAFARQAYYSLADKNLDPDTAQVTLLTNQPADFALGTLFVVGWGMAVRKQLFGRSTDDKAALLAAACYAGAYAKDINLAQGDATHTFILSPPDMDEATSAMFNLVGIDQAYGPRGTTGLSRIQSFVTGYGSGLSAC